MILKMTGTRTVPEHVQSSDVVTEFSVKSVQARVEVLTFALESGAGCLPPVDVHRAKVAIARTALRTSIAAGRTVVAFAGATGSGKSSLFNLLAGADVAQVGARRPTTSKPSAAIWGSESPSALLEWLMVGVSHGVDPTSAHGQVPELDGLVLLDLPDFDSQDMSNRVEADRVLELVDVFVWVTDPQKYADARLHEDYIAKLSAHDAVTITVLNQADRLSPEALAACRGDLVRLLGADGVLDAEVITTSVMDGRGLDDLRRRISTVVTGHHAAMQRLDSELRWAAHQLRASVADGELSLEALGDTTLVRALSRAAGIPVILEAVERDYRRETVVSTGWPLARWAKALRPTPLKLLGVKKDVSDPPAAISATISQSDVRSVLGRSSLPPATPAARAAVALATRQVGVRAGEDLPQAWTDAITDAVMQPGTELGDALDQAVVDTSLRDRDPFWWTVFGFVQSLLAMAAAAGLGWLVVVIALGRLRPTAGKPSLGTFLPLLLFAGCLLSGFLISLLTAAFGRVGGRRRKVLVAARLNNVVAQVARERLMLPVQEILHRHRMTREYLEAARQRA
jgi:GTP-binding protein EngB required for normal cell division